MSEQQGEPSEEELRAALEEQMRHIRVEDVLVQTLVTLINLGARRLGLTGPPEEEGERDLEQARLAIEGARALQGLVPQEGLEQVRDALAQLQMAYVREAQGGTADRGPQSAGPEAPSAPPTAPAAPDEDAERAKARSKIWTPPGS
jgi:hypothetical protein